VVIFQVILAVVGFATVVLGVAWWMNYDFSHDNAAPAMISTLTVVLAMGAQLVVRVLDVSVEIVDVMAAVVIVASFLLMCGKYVVDKRAEAERWQRATDLTNRHMPS